jgi:undecaprenyl-phosphate 4-deoxy-4-formamido-L-arabinose transferase
MRSGRAHIGSTTNDNTRIGERMTQSLSIVIPVYRSAAILPELYDQLVGSLEKLGEPFEIILVEDCGGDISWDVIKDLANHDSRVRGIRLSRNYGQHNALLCGIRAAQHEVIVTMDDDLQHPPDQIPLLLTNLHEGCDVVYGVPSTEQHGLLRDIASQLTKFALQSAMGAENARNVSAFRAFRTSIRDAFEDYRSPSVSVDVLLSWGTPRFCAVKVRHDRRRSGVSNYTVGKLTTHAFNLITGFSTTPLRLVSIIGFGFTLFGIAVLLWVLGIYLLYGSPVQGFVFLATIITTFAGVQLFAIGIFGEYLARIFGRTMDKPPYVMSETTQESVRIVRNEVVSERARSDTV